MSTSRKRAASEEPAPSARWDTDAYMQFHDRKSEDNDEEEEEEASALDPLIRIAPLALLSSERLPLGLPQLDTLRKSPPALLSSTAAFHRHAIKAFASDLQLRSYMYLHRADVNPVQDLAYDPSQHDRLWLRFTGWESDMDGEWDPDEIRYCSLLDRTPVDEQHPPVYVVETDLIAQCQEAPHWAHELYGIVSLPGGTRLSDELLRTDYTSRRRITPEFAFSISNADDFDGESDATELQTFPIKCIGGLVLKPASDSLQLAFVDPERPGPIEATRLCRLHIAPYQEPVRDEEDGDNDAGDAYEYRDGDPDDMLGPESDLYFGPFRSLDVLHSNGEGGDAASSSWRGLAIAVSYGETIQLLVAREEGDRGGIAISERIRRGRFGSSAPAIEGLHTFEVRLFKLKRSTPRILCHHFQLAPDARTLYMGLSDATVATLDIPKYLSSSYRCRLLEMTPSITHKFEEVSGPVTILYLFSEYELLVGWSDGSLRLVHAQTFVTLRRFTGHQTGPRHSLVSAFDKGRRLFALLGSDLVVRIWSVESSEPITPGEAAPANGQRAPLDDDACRRELGAPQSLRSPFKKPPSDMCFVEWQPALKGMPGHPPVDAAAQISSSFMLAVTCWTPNLVVFYG